MKMTKLVKTFESEIKEEYAALPLSGREEYDNILKGGDAVADYSKSEVTEKSDVPQ